MHLTKSAAPKLPTSGSASWPVWTGNSGFHGWILLLEYIITPRNVATVELGVLSRYVKQEINYSLSYDNFDTIFITYLFVNLLRYHFTKFPTTWKDKSIWWTVKFCPFLLFCCFWIFFRGRVSLCSAACLGTHYLDQDGLCLPMLAL